MLFTPSSYEAKHFLYCAIYLTVLFTTTNALAADAADRFTKQTDEDDYFAALKLSSEAIDKLLQRPNHGPMTTYGVKILKVAEDGQGSRIGMKPGDIIIAYDGKPVVERPHYFNLRGGPDQAKVTWINAEGEEKQGVIKKGLVGVGLTDARELIAWYARSGLRSDEWDKHVFLALSILEQWHDNLTDEALFLAETAMAYAVQSGMPDSEFVRSIAAELAWTRTDFELAWTYIKDLKPPKDADEPFMVPSRRLHVARAVNANKYAADLVEAGMINMQAILDHKAMQKWLEIGPLQPEGPSPSEIINKGELVNVEQINKQMRSNGRSRLPHTSNALLEDIRNSKSSDLTARPATYVSSALRHTDLPNYDMTAQFRVRPSGPSDEHFPNYLTLAVYDRDYFTKNQTKLFNGSSALSLLQIKFPDNLPPQIGFGAGPFYDSYFHRYPRIDKTKEKLHTIRLLQLDGRVEIQIDGITVLDTYGYQTSDDRVLFFHIVGLKITGLEIKIHRVDWKAKNAA